MMGLEGTPGFIIGNVQSFGGMTLKQLETSVANARKASHQSETNPSRRKANRRGMNDPVLALPLAPSLAAPASAAGPQVMDVKLIATNSQGRATILVGCGSPRAPAGTAIGATRGRAGSRPWSNGGRRAASASDRFSTRRQP